ncbi:uncharacterized protein LOC110228255 [Arabidopsis lyrata subsp. lyrata]|uniref:uncharacterized protein LOC110228255 n=1 Tax=Arabidopsis lyrata subsp. lyrata TaxID=81972 RepID=UPI000A29C445|nr:uncharacterized protein LOC110228255 [Arabidopsis lyrata subsp. lyrata]|eukprot:XP_020880677.1 uncharacterized protein LOC110228255 [Arabidopsis lyrata subsp. lyrata]
MRTEEELRICMLVFRATFCFGIYFYHFRLQICYGTCKQSELKQKKMLEFSRKAGMRRRRLMFSCRVMQLRTDVSKESEEIYDEHIRKVDQIEGPYFCVFVKRKEPLCRCGKSGEEVVESKQHLQHLIGICEGVK